MSNDRLKRVTISGATTGRLHEIRGVDSLTITPHPWGLIVDTDGDLTYVPHAAQCITSVENEEDGPE